MFGLRDAWKKQSYQRTTVGISFFMTHTCKEPVPADALYACGVMDSCTVYGVLDPPGACTCTRTCTLEPGYGFTPISH